MGMFDDVAYKDDCPNCGAPLKGFQTKDGDCVMQTVKPEDVRNFYTICGQCEEWVEYHVIPRGIDIQRTHYNLKAQREARKQIDGLAAFSKEGE